MAVHTNYRVIIRFSLTDDKSSAVRNETIAKLKEIGFDNTKTGVWESSSSDIIQIQKVLSGILEDLAILSADDSFPTILNHLWIYIDKA
jgi:hypothetical protein